MSVPERFILVLDHGTTSIRACLLDREGRIVVRSQRSAAPIYPKPGWVEQDPDALWMLTLDAIREALAMRRIAWSAIAAVALTNQRETTIVWDRYTGKPVHNAISWQCRRTADFCERLKRERQADAIRRKTGLVIDAYFSASKIHWLLTQAPCRQDYPPLDRLLFGTVDTWILWKLSGGASPASIHVTDATNASRTMLFNIHERRWDPDLLQLFGIPASMLPEIKPSNAVIGRVDPALTDGVEVPLAGIAGDQQAALHGQKCWTPGEVKSTYGTGAFLMMNTGREAVQSRQGLLTTLAVDGWGEPVYALEGPVFCAGASLEWLTKKLGALQDVSQMDALAELLPDNEGVYLVPAFVGLGAPYWDSGARGAIFGLTQDSGREHLVRAALEAMAYRTRDVLEAMRTEAGLFVDRLRVDGGVTRSDFLMQFLADILDLPVVRTNDAELTAKGAGYLAGLAVDFWRSPDEIAGLPEETRTFEPGMATDVRDRLWQGWKAAIHRVLSSNSTPQQLQRL